MCVCVREGWFIIINSSLSQKLLVERVRLTPCSMYAVTSTEQKGETLPEHCQRMAHNEKAGNRQNILADDIQRKSGKLIEHFQLVTHDAKTG